MKLQNPNMQSDLRYVNISSPDGSWGLCVTTAGFQRISPSGVYPSKALNREDSYFQPQKGRVLSEYQLVYIVDGSGVFEAASFPSRKVRAGTVIMLFPDEWHTYAPDGSGWSEHWVGFKGEMIQKWITNGIFSPERPLHEIGISHTIIDLYERILQHAQEERIGFQQLIAGELLNLIGEIYYREKNIMYGESDTVKKIIKAREMMKQNIDRPLPLTQIAEQLCVSYSWFRRMFKEYTGVSPALYQQNLRHLRAKELLSSTAISISEIAYLLNFEGVSQFSISFAKKEGMPPSQFRRNSGHR